MSRDQFQITPSVLRWACSRAGLSSTELRETFRNYEEWEAGEGGPTYPQLEALAEKLKVPIAVFFFPQPPTMPLIEETFRTLPEAFLTELPSKMRLLLRKAKAFQINFNELCRGNNPAPQLITRDLSFAVNDNVTGLAASARSYLGVSIGEQISWSSADEALKQWRLRMEAVGVFVFKDAFGTPQFSGFCLTDVVFPIIYVNNSCAKTRQAFTIFHELAHLLFSTSGIDSDTELPANPGNSRLIEIACNAFAAEFLLPTEVFETARRGLPATEQTATVLAARYHVSRESIFRRFLDRGDISRTTYEAAARVWASERREGSGGDYYRTKLAYLGRTYVSLALSAFRQNRISEGQLAEYLDIKPRNITGLEERFVQSGAAA